MRKQELAIAGLTVLMFACVADSVGSTEGLDKSTGVSCGQDSPTPSECGGGESCVWNPEGQGYFCLSTSTVVDKRIDMVRESDSIAMTGICQNNVQCMLLATEDLMIASAESIRHPRFVRETCMRVAGLRERVEAETGALLEADEPIGICVRSLPLGGSCLDDAFLGFGTQYSACHYKYFVAEESRWARHVCSSEGSCVESEDSGRVVPPVAEECSRLQASLCSGQCVDLTDNVHHCGACGSDCTHGIEGSEASCQAGVCVDSPCVREGAAYGHGACGDFAGPLESAAYQQCRNGSWADIADLATCSCVDEYGDFRSGCGLP